MELVLGTAGSDLLESIHLNWHQNSQLRKIISDLKQKPQSHPKYSGIRDELKRRGKLVIGSNPVSKETILHCLHSSAIRGHSGRDVTTSRVKAVFNWKAGFLNRVFTHTNAMKKCGEKITD